MRLAMLALLVLCAVASCEEVARLDFDNAPQENLFTNTWGDKPVEIIHNGPVSAADPGAPAGSLKLRFGPETANKLSYWTLNFADPVPIMPGMRQISFRVRANVPVSIKIPISPFGFIYHGPGVQPSEEWQTLTVDEAHAELSAWCARGEKDANLGFVPGVIVAIGTTPDVVAEVTVADVTVSGDEGTRDQMRAELKARQFRRVRASVVTLPWSDEGRSLESVLDRLDEAAIAGSDIVCLPMECVKTGGESIPGPISDAIAAKAREHSMYVIGNIRERDGERVYVTSFLCDRRGELVGTYRKSHKMPDEDMDLGDDLPVFSTDFGQVAMRIGSDRYFADIDHVYTVKGARMIFWSQMPEPVEDETLQDFPSQGRAQDYSVFIACARYARAEPGWITNFFPPYRGNPIGRSYIINREGQRVASTTRKGSVATAIIPASELQAGGRGRNLSPAFDVLTEPVRLPEPREWTRRKVRVTCIENHVGFEDLLAKLDQAGEMGSDLVCTYEFVWVPIHESVPTPEKVAELEEIARERCRKVAEKADQWNMYVLLCGVVEKREINEGILYGREGEEVGRYRKIATTYPEQIAGTETPILTADFGRIGVRICADNYMVELDRSYGVKGADIMVFSTQDWGPDAIHRNLREISRCMDAQMFHVQATHSTSEVAHRSMIVEPTGNIVATTRYMAGGLVSAVIDLDNDRPRRYVRNWTPFEPKGYLPEYQSTEVPEARNDLKDTILAQRRPELYQALKPPSE